MKKHLSGLRSVLSVLISLPILIIMLGTIWILPVTISFTGIVPLILVLVFFGILLIISIYTLPKTAVGSRAFVKYMFLLYIFCSLIYIDIFLIMNKIFAWWGLLLIFISSILIVGTIIFVLILLGGGADNGEPDFIAHIFKR